MYLVGMKIDKSYLLWVARIGASLIMLQTLFFKFSASEESVYIFSTIGMEPWGRIGVGIMELVASILLLIPPISWFGALLAFGLMGGALGMHATLLGIEVQGDGGYLFYLALVVMGCATYVLWHDQKKLKHALSRFGF